MSCNVVFPKVPVRPDTIDKMLFSIRVMMGHLKYLAGKKGYKISWKVEFNGETVSQSFQNTKELK